jgi:hypothetical protein
MHLQKNQHSNEEMGTLNRNSQRRDTNDQDIPEEVLNFPGYKKRDANQNNT